MFWWFLLHTLFRNEKSFYVTNSRGQKHYSKKVSIWSQKCKKKSEIYLQYSLANFEQFQSNSQSTISREMNNVQTSYLLYVLREIWFFGKNPKKKHKNQLFATFNRVKKFPYISQAFRCFWRIRAFEHKIIASVANRENLQYFFKLRNIPNNEKKVIFFMFFIHLSMFL